MDGLRRAADLHASGDIAGARKQAEAVLASQPNNATVLQFAGVLCCQSGDTRRGADLLRRSLKLNPKDSSARLNLVRALIDLGELNEAEACCADPYITSASPELRRIRAEILKRQGRLAEAISEYEGLVETQPDDVESWNNLGTARGEAGDTRGALTALERARTLRPDSAVVHVNISRMLAANGASEDGLAFLQEAVRLAPKDPAILLEFGQALSHADRSGDALLPLGAAARLDPKNPEIFVAIGLAFKNLDSRTQAEQALRVAVQIGPDFGPGYLNLGILLEQANRLNELDALLRRADSRGLTGDEIAYLRALSYRRKGKIREALALVQSTEPSAINAAVRAHFIGQLADQLDEVDTAFAAFKEMNETMADAQVAPNFDGTEYSGKVQRMADLTTSEWVSAWPTVTVPSEPAAPVFMVGFPRSGTTLLDTILMGHEDTHVLEELPILAQVADMAGDLTQLSNVGSAEVAHLRARYFEEVEKASPAPSGKLIVDKNPLSMLRLPLIYRLFPDAKIILVLRHPCDVVLSCYMQNFKVTESMSSFLDLKNAAIFYDRVFSYWQKCQEIFPLRVHTVRYEAMVADVEGEIRPLLKFLGLPWDDAILDHQRTAAERGYIRTPSYAQVTERVYKRASGRWERYREYMNGALPLLEPWVQQFGYSDSDAPST